MDQIKNHLTERYNNAYSRIERISESTTELEFETKYNGIDTRIVLSREVNRLSGLKVTVKPAINPTYTTTSGQSFADFYNGSIFRMLLIFFIFSFIIRFLINLSIALYNSNPLLLIIPIGIVILGIRYLFNFGNSSTNKQPSVDLQPLSDQIVGILSELSQGNQNTDIKCWNCFKTISTNDNVCAFCGKQLS